MGIPKEYVWLFLVSVFLQEILDRVMEEKNDEKA